MAKRKKIIAESKPINLPERKPKFKMSNVPEYQKIKKKDSKLIGEQITNCHKGNRYKLTIKKIYTDKKKQLCIECIDQEYKIRNFLAEHCKLVKKPGIRKKNSKLSSSKKKF